MQVLNDRSGVWPGLPSLTAEKQHSPEKPEEIDRQKRFQEQFPVHLLLRIDSANFINPTLDGIQKVEPGTFAPVDLGDITSQWIAQRHQRCPLQYHA